MFYEVRCLVSHQSKASHVVSIIEVNEEGHRAEAPNFYAGLVEKLVSHPNAVCAGVFIGDNETRITSLFFFPLSTF